MGDRHHTNRHKGVCIELNNIWTFSKFLITVEEIEQTNQTPWTQNMNIYEKSVGVEKGGV